MGFSKQTADVHGSTMVAVVAGTLLDAGITGIVVVTRTELLDSLALPTGDRVNVVINDDPNSEMIDSIGMGCTWLVDHGAALTKLFADDGAPVDPQANRDGVMVIPADMPKLSVSTCRACVDVYTADPSLIVIATYRGKRGHPIVFPLALRDVATAQGGGLRMLPRAFPDRVFLLETLDEGATLDVDTPNDFRQL